MKKYEFIKNIPEEWREKLGATRFKISLIKAQNLKEVQKLKILLELKVQDIYQNPHLQSKQASVQYLKDCINLFLLGVDIINGTNSFKPKKIITIQSIMEKAIETRSDEYKRREKILGNQGVDISIKKDSTIVAYRAILKHLTIHFGDNFNIEYLNVTKAKEFANKFGITYLKHLKSIFGKAQKEDATINNPWRNIGVSVEERYGNIEKDTKFFRYDDIQEIEKKLNNEKRLLFKTLLLSGMRFDEVMSIKKYNVSVADGCFKFKDSKGYFSKVVPIHKDILPDILSAIKNLNDDNYLFENVKGRDIEVPRSILNDVIKEVTDITLHYTRSTFVTYANYFAKPEHRQNDIEILTHKAKGIDQAIYNKSVNIDRLRDIINNIDLKKLNEIKKL